MKPSDKTGPVPHPSAPTQSTPWISVGQLEAAFAPESYRLPPNSVLSGRGLRLSFEGGAIADYRFEGPDQLSFVLSGTNTVPRAGRARYLAAQIRPQIVWVDYVDPTVSSSSVSLVLDLAASVCTAIIGRLPTAAEARRPLLDRISQGGPLTAVEATCLSGAIDRDWTSQTARHLASDELLGRRIQYQYSATECYEHIYLNERFYTWHCLQGAERGLADTDQCLYRRVAEQLYLFSWQEKVVATLGVVLVDLRQRQTAGKLFGYANAGSDASSNFPVGARIVRIIESGA